MTAVPALREDVAVLYVDPRGPYPSLVRYWFDEERNASSYAGDLPVVAHPPCGPWGVMRHLCRKLEERPLALRAVEQVRAFGGVLEHPRGSRLFHEEDSTSADSSRDLKEKP